MTDRQSFSNIKIWIAGIKEHAALDIRMALVANKVDDIDSREVTRFEGQNAAEDNNMMYFEVSAKLNLGIKDCIDSMLKEVYENVIMRP